MSIVVTVGPSLLYAKYVISIGYLFRRKKIFVNNLNVDYWRNQRQSYKGIPLQNRNQITQVVES